MTPLYLHDRTVESVFDLLGHRENDVTFSIGWVLSKCPDFLFRVVRHACPSATRRSLANASIRLQHPDRDKGFTDIEITADELHLIVEAKRGWNLPAARQLRRYVPRFGNTKSRNCVFLCMSECSNAYAAYYLPPRSNSIRVRHISWAGIAGMAANSRGGHAEQHLLRELQTYVRRIVNMQKQDSNWVYVLSLSREEWVPGLTSVQVVTERKRYFHPFGTNGWPSEPPNYLGFRYDGCLQSIHHVEEAVVERNFHRFFREASDKDGRPYIHYRLGPAIRPNHTVKTGRVYANGRIWAMLDLLLTCKTIADARNKSQKREGGQE